jgi:hypothetical protein
MLEFRIGERVSFRPTGRSELAGVLSRYNKKTVTVITDDGQRWNVSPAFLRKVARDRKGDGSVIELHKQ